MTKSSSIRLYLAHTALNSGLAGSDRTAHDSALAVSDRTVHNSGLAGSDRTLHDSALAGSDRTVHDSGRIELGLECHKILTQIVLGSGCIMLAQRRQLNNRTLIFSFGHIFTC